MNWRRRLSTDAATPEHVSPGSDGPRPRRRFLTASVLAFGMAFGTVAGPILGVLSPAVIERFAISTAQFGLVLSLYSLLGMALAPVAGAAVDRVGVGRSLFLLFGCVGLGFAMVALAPGYLFLVVGVAVVGAGNAFANPATNLGVRRFFMKEERGLVTGIKQSGVQVGILGSGVIVAPLLLVMGWRPLFLALAMVSFLFLPIIMRLLPTSGLEDPTDTSPTIDPASDETARARPAKISQPWLHLAFGSFFMGNALSVFVGYLPLYSIQTLGFDVQTAGWVAAVLGGTGIASRLTWAIMVGRIGTPRTALLWIGAGSLAAMLLTWWAASSGYVALFWIAVAALGLTSMGWNSAVMMIILVSGSGQDIGRVSGRVMFGFLAGYAFSPWLFGTLRDATGSFDAGLLYVSATLVAVCIGALLSLRRDRRRRLTSGSVAATSKGT